jgi:16S rRNA (cytosine1402-N4)-methyltransferase
MNSEVGIMYHVPVLLQEVVEFIRPRDGGLYVDGTVGGGGHARELLRASGPGSRLIGLDWDEEAILQARDTLSEFGARVQLVRASYAELERVLMSLGVTSVDGMILDLGASSRQFDEPSRGFSFQREGPLDMRMNRTGTLTARELLAQSSVEELTRIFREYGEERRAAAVARAIDWERSERGPLETTVQLARLVEKVLGKQQGGVHPATRVFQALRIAVNDELNNVRVGLELAAKHLKSGGRLAVITFHSLEDRIVKQFFVGRSRPCVCPPALPVCACGQKQTLQIVTRKPVVPGEDEVRANPRARSAKLRVAEKV